MAVASSIHFHNTMNSQLVQSKTMQSLLWTTTQVQTVPGFSNSAFNDFHVETYRPFYSQAMKDNQLNYNIDPNTLHPLNESSCDLWNWIVKNADTHWVGDRGKSLDPMLDPSYTHFNACLSLLRYLQNAYVKEHPNVVFQPTHLPLLSQHLGAFGKTFLKRSWDNNNLLPTDAPPYPAPKSNANAVMLEEANSTDWQEIFIPTEEDGTKDAKVQQKKHEGFCRIWNAFKVILMSLGDNEQQVWSRWTCAFNTRKTFMQLCHALPGFALVIDTILEKRRKTSVHARKILFQLFHFFTFTFFHFYFSNFFNFYFSNFFTSFFHFSNFELVR